MGQVIFAIFFFVWLQSNKQIVRLIYCLLIKTSLQSSKASSKDWLRFTNSHFLQANTLLSLKKHSAVMETAVVL